MLKERLQASQALRRKALGHGPTLFPARNHAPAPATFTIPDQNPRIFWTPKRIALAGPAMTGLGFAPDPNNDPWNNALAYVLYGDTDSGQRAIEALASFTISDAELGGVASDTYRWNDWVPVAYDWVYPLWSSQGDSRLAAFGNRYQYYVDTIDAKDWGGPGMPWSNYFWGYFRNKFLWNVARGDLAGLLQVLANRWQAFLDWAAASPGGVPPEGGQYGPYMLAYPMLPLLISRDLGHDLFQDTTWFADAVAWLARWMTNCPVLKQTTSDRFLQLFTWGDDEGNGGNRAASSSYIGDFLTVMQIAYAGTPTAQLSADISAEAGEGNSWWTDACFVGLDLPGDVPAPRSSLAPNFAAGSVVSLRSSWDPNGSQILIQTAYLGGAHSHFDKGSFQGCRGDRWLLKESTGYDLAFNGFSSQDTMAHNAMTFGGVGHSWSDDPTTFRRDVPDSGPSYIGLDLSATYAGVPGLSQYARHYVWLPDLEALVLYDQAIMSDPSVPIEFNLHTQAVPAAAGAKLTVTVDDQSLVIQPCWLPAVATTDENSGADPDPACFQQHSVLSTVSEAINNLVTVLQFRDVTDDDLGVLCQLGQDVLTIALAHPTKGRRLVMLPTAFADPSGTIQ